MKRLKFWYIFKLLVININLQQCLGSCQVLIGMYVQLYIDMCLFCGKYVCLLTLTLSLREEKDNPNFLILPTFGCVLAWLMASRPGNSQLCCCGKEVKCVRKDSKAAERSHCWVLENKILREENEGWTLRVCYSLGHQCVLCVNR